MNEVRCYGKNRKHKHRKCYWTDIEAWADERFKLTGKEPVRVNVTSNSKDFGRDLSPMRLGLGGGCWGATNEQERY